MQRVALLSSDAATATRLRDRVDALAATLIAASALRSLPIRTLVSMQVGAGLLALATQG